MAARELPVSEMPNYSSWRITSVGRNLIVLTSMMILDLSLGTFEYRKRIKISRPSKLHNESTLTLYLVNIPVLKETKFLASCPSS